MTMIRLLSILQDQEDLCHLDHLHGEEVHDLRHLDSEAETGQDHSVVPEDHELPKDPGHRVDLVLHERDHLALAIMVIISSTEHQREMGLNPRHLHLPL